MLEKNVGFAQRKYGVASSQHVPPALDAQQSVCHNRPKLLSGARIVVISMQPIE
jgi:hypothetical protein